MVTALNSLKENVYIFRINELWLEIDNAACGNKQIWKVQYTHVQGAKTAPPHTVHPLVTRDHHYYNIIIIIVVIVAAASSSHLFIAALRDASSAYIFRISLWYIQSIFRLFDDTISCYANAAVIWRSSIDYNRSFTPAPAAVTNATRHWYARYRRCCLLSGDNAICEYKLTLNRARLRFWFVILCIISRR